MKKKWTFSPLIPMAYDGIIIDLPTEHTSYSSVPGAKAAPYPTMDDRWIASLPVGQLASANCLILMWTTMPKLKASLEWLEGYGFTYVTAGAWGKTTKNGLIANGNGKVLWSRAEVFLLGRIGEPKYINRPQPGLIETEEYVDFDFDEWADAEINQYIRAMRREHSRKPDFQYEIMDGLLGSECRKAELFARPNHHSDSPFRQGYETWGNEAEHFEGFE